MNMSRKISTLSTTAAVLLFAIGCGTPKAITSTGSHTDLPSNHVSVTSQAPAAPDFSLPSLDGHKTVSLKQLLGKQPILINAWASWCGPCQGETPDLVKLASEYKGKIQVIGVNMTSNDTVANVRPFVQKFGVTYPVLLDTKGQFQSSYGIQGFPTTFLISPAGKVVNVRPGAFLSLKDMQTFVAEVTQ